MEILCPIGLVGYFKLILKYNLYSIIRYRLQTVKSLAGVSLMLRLLWACLKWDDMAAKAPPGGGTTRTGIIIFNFWFSFAKAFGVNSQCYTPSKHFYKGSLSVVPFEFCLLFLCLESIGLIGDLALFVSVINLFQKQLKLKLQQQK